MTSEVVVSIVPRLPPQVGGVGDYALNLAREMRAKSNIETIFIVATESHREPRIDGFEVVSLLENSTQKIEQALLRLQQRTPKAVLLHLSGYGYAKWSLYGWLLSGLEHWKQQSSNAVLVTIVHEWSNPPGLPWKHNFWTYLPQERLIRRVVRLSDRCLTNCETHRARILRHSRHRDIPVMPVFSNIGEPKSPPPIIVRKRQLVVFGKSIMRCNSYKNSLQDIEKLCDRLSIEQIIDIGLPTGLPLSKLFSRPVTQCGPLPASEVSQILLESLVGWICYAEKFLEKSSVFAAYCSHGMVPVVKNKSSLNTTEAGQKMAIKLSSNLFMNPPDERITLDALQTVATNAYNWYQKHTLSQQSEIFIQTVLAEKMTHDFRTVSSIQTIN